MELKNNWRQQSLERLENKSWGDPESAPTPLIERCIELTKIPVEEFDSGDLRIMIGQSFDLSYLIPLALEKLKDDIFLEADYYEGDLLSYILDVDPSFWSKNQPYWAQVYNLIKDNRHKITELKISTSKFDSLKFE